MIVRRLAVLTLAAAMWACSEVEDQQVNTERTAETAGPAPAPAPHVTGSGLIDPNSATPEQLATVTNITPALADTIVQGRPYRDMRAVDRALASLTVEQRDSVYTRVWIPLDLNTATKEEIELIPGVGPRMRHEFEEYRPYTSIEQFRREIGKYVDADEVARLERYVTIRNTNTTQ